MGNSSCSSSYFLSRFLFGALLVGLFCVVVVVGEGTRKESAVPTESAEIVVKQDHHVDGKDNNKHVESAELDYYNYMSKRRVPNGPDPIHNRRAGNSGRPPGQA